MDKRGVARAAPFHFESKKIFPVLIASIYMHGLRLSISPKNTISSLPLKGRYAVWRIVQQQGFFDHTLFPVFV